MKKEKGITLIALIITIIVMLILVAVTINVALNGGLFTRAKNASKQTQIAADKELLEMDLVTAIETDGTIDFNKLKEAAVLDGFTIIGSSLPCTATSKNLNEFSISLDGKVTYIGELSEEDKELALLNKYFVGKSLLSLMENTEIEDATEAVFKDGTGETSSIKGTDITIINQSGTANGFCFVINYAKSNNNYKLMCKVTLDPNDEDEFDIIVESIETYNGEIEPDEPTIENNIGKYVQFEGILWRILYDDEEHGLQLISANTLEVGGIFLGRFSNVVDWTDTDIIQAANLFNDTSPGKSVLTEEEKAIYVYNNLIELLNERCALAVNSNNINILDIRCVGSNPISKNSENSTMYTSALLQSLPEDNNVYATGVFDKIAKSTDTNYEEDYNQMQSAEMTRSDNSKEYWLASRIINEEDNTVGLSVRYIWNNGVLSYQNPLAMLSTGPTAYSTSSGIRPVISITSSLLNSANGSGTSIDPFVIE